MDKQEGVLKYFVKKYCRSLCMIINKINTKLIYKVYLYFINV